MSEKSLVVELDRLYLLDVDRTLFRSGEFMLALHDALLKTVNKDDESTTALPDKDQVVKDIKAESLPFATYYRDKGISLKTLYDAAQTLDDAYVYGDVFDTIDQLPGRVILYTKGERDTQEIKLHHSKLSKKSEEGAEYDEASNPAVWIVQTNKGVLLKQAIDEDASKISNSIVLRWNNVVYRTKELIFVDDKFDEIKPLVNLACSGDMPLLLAHIVRKDSKYGPADARDRNGAVVEINTLRDLESKLHERRIDKKK